MFSAESGTHICPSRWPLATQIIFISREGQEKKLDLAKGKQPIAGPPFLHFIVFDFVLLEMAIALMQ